MGNRNLTARNSWRCVQEIDGRVGLRNGSLLRVERRVRVHECRIQSRYLVARFRFESWNTKRRLAAAYRESRQARACIAYGQWTLRCFCIESVWPVEHLAAGTSDRKGVARGQLTVRSALPGYQPIRQ